MSQHFYKTTTSSGIEVEIQAGWDRKLGYFYLVVDTLDDEEPLYSNLFEPDGGLSQTKSFSYYQQILDEAGISLPSGFVEEIENDMANNVGNRIVDWSDEI